MTLEHLAAKFNHWRINKKSKSEQIPRDLWQEVFALEAHGHSISRVCRSLSLSSAQVTKQRSYHTIDMPKQSTDFIDISSQMAAVAPTDNHDTQCEVKLNLNDKTLHLSLPVSQLTHILPNLRGLLQ
jgi:hypothetical protein